MYDQLARIWIDRINTKTAPIAAFSFLVLVMTLSILPVLQINNLQEIFLYSKIYKPFVPRRIEGKISISGNKNRKELCSLNHRKNTLWRESYSQSRFSRNRNRKIFNILNRNEDNIFCLVCPTLPLREFSRWEISQNPNQKILRKEISKRVFRHRSFIKKYRNVRKRSTFLKYKQKWQEILITKPKVVWLKMVLRNLEKQEVLFFNSFYWANCFEQNWKRKKMKNWSKLQFSDFKAIRKFRFSTYKKIIKEETKVQIPNPLLVFSSHPKNITIFQIKSSDSRLPFSNVSYIPRTKRKTFQKRTRKGEKEMLFLNITISERFEQNPCSTGLPRRWIPFSDFCQNKNEPKFILQESCRLFESTTLTNQQLGQYLANGDYIREKAEITRSEARWMTRISRRWKNNISTYTYRRPYRRVQPSEWILSRRFHPWRASYQRIIRKGVDPFFLKYLKKRWDERKRSLVIFSKQNSFGDLNLSIKQNRTHHFQRSIHLSPVVRSSFVNSKTFFQTEGFIAKGSWGRWNSPNLPLLAKARWNWTKNWNIRNPFLLGETRRAGSLYRNRCGSHNLSWWKIIGPIFLEFKNSRSSVRQTNGFLTTFYQNYRSDNAFINLKNFFSPIFSSLYLEISLDQRTLSLIRIKKIRNEKVKRVADYTILPQPKRKSLRVLPFRFFFLLKTRSLLKLGFRSVQKDFVDALYQIIRRGRRIEIEPEWIEWLLEQTGISKQNAGIRIYLIGRKKRTTLVKQITGLKKEIPFFLDLLIYLRRQKRKSFFQKFQIKKVEEKLLRFRFRKTSPPPLLLIGAPGTGKTRLVRALANEARVPVVYQCLAAFSDASIFSSFGFGRTIAPQAVQRGFREARSQIPAIFFLDEIDVFGISRQSFSSKIEKFVINPINEDKLNVRKKGSQGTPIKQARRNENEVDHDLGLGQILVELDRKKKNHGLVFFRATNRPQELDPALVRPGRFHQILSILIPSKKKRSSLLKLYLKRFSILKTPYWINFREFNQKKRKWRTWIIRIKGKSPAYFSALRNLAALHQRTHKNISSFEHRIEVAWNRIESSRQQNLRRGLLKKRNPQKIDMMLLNYFLEYQYIERRTFYQEDKKTIRKWGQLFFSIPVKNKGRQSSVSNIMSILFQRCWKTSTFKSRKLSLFLVKKEKIFEKRKFLKVTRKGLYESSLDYFIQQSRTSKDWPIQRYDFEVLEPVSFHTFSWIPFEKQIFQQNPRDSFQKNKLKSKIHNFYKIDISLINLGLIRLHQSRRNLDLLVSRKYFF
jgi:hypothetical protein